MRLQTTLVLSFLVVASATAADWPQWRGPNRDGVSTEKGLLTAWPEKGPAVIWNSKEANKDVEKGKNVGTGWSSLAIVGNRIYTMGDHGKDCHIVCLDRDTGKLVWSTPIGGTRANDGPRCTPTVDAGHVYGLTNAGQLACVSAETGKVVWTRDFVKEFAGKSMASWHYCESPLIDGDKLICTPGGDDAALAALDKKTGKTLWTSKIPGTGGCGYASIVVSNGGGVRQYVTLMGGGKNGGLVGVDAKTGEFLWNYRRIANGTGNIPTPIVKGDLIFTSTGYGTGAALLRLSNQGGRVQMKEEYFLPGKTLQNHHGQLVLVGEYVYGGHEHNEGHPFCLHMESGKFAWGPIGKNDHPGRGSAAITYADGHVYFRWQDNVMGLVEASPGGYVLKGQFNLPGNLGTGWQHPVVLDGKLYIRGRDQVICYDVKRK